MTFDSQRSSRVPPPPTASFEAACKSTPAATRASFTAPLDEGFLNRTYVTTLWVGALLAMMAYGQTRSLRATGSVIVGLVLGALLLKSQEIFVRRVLSATNATGGRDKKNLVRAGWMFLLGAKLGGLMLLLGVSFGAGWLVPGAFTIGFLTEQLILVAKVTGRFLALKLRSTSPGNGEMKAPPSNFNSHVA